MRNLPWLWSFALVLLASMTSAQPFPSDMEWTLVDEERLVVGPFCVERLPKVSLIDAEVLSGSPSRARLADFLNTKLWAEFVWDQNEPLVLSLVYQVEDPPSPRVTSLVTSFCSTLLACVAAEPCPPVPMPEGVMTLDALPGGAAEIRVGLVLGHAGSEYLVRQVQSDSTLYEFPGLPLDDFRSGAGTIEVRMEFLAGNPLLVSGAPRGTPGVAIKSATLGPPRDP